MIYVSTGGYSNNTFHEVADLLKSTEIKGLELSAGQYCPNLDVELERVYQSFDIALHNYFPVPKVPFVFNLASNNNKIARMSVAHAKQAIKISSKLGIKHYSFHAGYLLDPSADQLGSKLKADTLIDRIKGIENFVRRANELAFFASEHSVQLLVENNVFSEENSRLFTAPPLLAVNIEETEHIFSLLDNNIKLLIDVGHLKVSAKTLTFNPLEYLSHFYDIVGGYHLSDNCGTIDSNQPVTADAWFWNHMRDDITYYSIEVYHDSPRVLEQQYRMVKDFLGKG